ncbi:MAG TPA: CYTH domain-containing protein [Longimicrobiales bacterium]
MPVEIERRFVVRADPRLLRDAERIPLRQGYLTVRDATTVRIRQEGARWVLAVKADAGGIARHEIEVEVPESDGRELLALAIGGSVEKTRHLVERWEIDVYEGRYAGLVVAEVELASEDEPLPPVPDGLELVREITREIGLSARGLAALDAAAAAALVGRLNAGGR